MKTKHKILIGLLALAVIYLAYGFVKLRGELFGVFDAPDKYTQKTSPDADLVIVDFNSYSCDHCRIFHPLLKQAIEKDGKVKYIPRIVTLNDDWSRTLTIATYAAAEQGKFIEMFDAIYDKWPISSREKLFDIARDIGIDTQQLSRDMEDPEIANYIDENMQWMTAWRFNRTPTLLVGSKIFTYKEQPTLEELLQKFQEAR